MMESIKKFGRNEDANVQMIGSVVGILVTLIVAVLIFYNIAGSISTSDIDANFGAATPAGNATNDTLDQAATFFTIAPLVCIVIVAVVILRYVATI